jgi:hypothetical protein
MEINEDKTQFQVDRMLPNMLNAELKGMVVDLANLLEERQKNVGKVQQLIMQIAKRIYESKICEPSKISSKIKGLLRESTVSGKITARHIHRCLPAEYKRQYRSKWDRRSLLTARAGDKTAITNSHYNITERNGVVKILCYVPLGSLETNLKTLDRVLGVNDPCFKILIDTKSKRLLKFEIGDSRPANEIYWFSLTSYYERTHR